MHRVIIFVCIVGFATFIHANSGNASVKKAVLEDIQTRYKVPGMSVLVASGGVTKPIIYPFSYYNGVRSNDTGGRVDANTYFPIASVSKVFASHLLMELVNSGKLSLNDPVKKWVPSAQFIKEVSVADVLSHQLIGRQSDTFFYDQRFNLITAIFERITQQKYEESIVEKLQAQFSSSEMIAYTASSTAQVRRAGQLASGHIYDGELQVIEHDFGVSASAGLIATPASLVNAGVKLMNLFVAQDDKAHVFDSANNNAMYSNGFFRHKLHDKDVLWSYGQYDGYASLWIIVPEEELQLVMLSNNNILSDASRLIFGDLTRSPLANWFTQHFTCHKAECDLTRSNALADVHRKVYFSRYSKSAYTDAINGITALYPSKLSWERDGDLNLLHLSNYLFTVSHHLAYSPPHWSESEDALLLNDSHAVMLKNPYWLYYAGNVYDRRGDKVKANKAFTAILNIVDMPNHWTVNEAQVFLNKEK